jgi:hypothetical protein
MDFQRATAQMLTEMAVQSKTTIEGWLEGKMILRAPKFIKSKIRWKRAKSFKPIDQQFSTVGSIEVKKSSARGAFSGLVEQETGKRTKRKRVATIKGRRGSKRHRLKPTARLKRRDFPSKEGFPGRDNWMESTGLADRFGSTFDDFQIWGMLRYLDRDNWRKPFIITGHSSIPPGVYQFGTKRNQHGGREIVLLNAMDPKRKQPRVNRWMTHSIRRYFRRTDLDKEWMLVSRRMVYRKLYGRRG